MTTEPQRPGAAGPTSSRGVCRNCGAVLAGPWCAACGQEDRPLDVTVHDVLGDAWEALTNLEGRAFRSLGRLFLAPGFLTREYIEGRRARWESPVRVYLAVSLVYFGLTSLTGWGGIEIEANATGETAVQAQQELEQLGFSSQAEFAAAANEAVSTWLPRAMFLLVPIFAALVAVARRAAGKTYPQHLVFSLHVHAAAFAAFALAALITGPVGSERFSGVVQVAGLGYALVYLILAQRSVYEGSLRRNIVLGLVIGGMYGVLTIAVTVAILMPIVLAAR